MGTNQPRMRVYELTNDFDLINYNDYKFTIDKATWMPNYNFKEYYGLPFDQVIDGKLMADLQK